MSEHPPFHYHAMRLLDLYVHNTSKYFESQQKDDELVFDNAVRCQAMIQAAANHLRYTLGICVRDEMRAIVLDDVIEGLRAAPIEVEEIEKTEVKSYAERLQATPIPELNALNRKLNLGTQAESDVIITQ